MSAPPATPDASRSEVLTISNTKCRVTLKKTTRGFYRAYAELKFSTHMELCDLSAMMPDLFRGKIIKMKKGSTFATNPHKLAMDYLEGLVIAREAQIECLSQWGQEKIFTEHEQQGINMLQKAIKKSKEDKEIEPIRS